VTLVAVVNLKAPASASISSVRFDQVLANVSVAKAATANIPPSVGIVVDPVVKRTS
jgi:hypothetical protein